MNHYTLINNINNIHEPLHSNQPKQLKDLNKKLILSVCCKLYKRRSIELNWVETNRIHYHSHNSIYICMYKYIRIYSYICIYTYNINIYLRSSQRTERLPGPQTFL